MGLRRNRKRRRASGIYKLEPLFRDPDKKTLVVEDATHYIEGRVGEHLVVSVPETTTRASAMELESAFAELAKKPVLVVTHNITFLRATLLTSKEELELVEIFEKTVGSEEGKPDGGV